MDRQVAILATLLAAACAPLDTHPPAAQRVNFAAVGDDRLAFVQAGRGEPLIFVHGGFQDWRMWAPFLPSFADDYRVIAYSRRNHFPNPTDPNGTPDGAADRHARDLAQLVQTLGLGPVNLVGHSSGAFTALFFAAENPGLVRSLVLVEPPAASLLTQSADDREALSSFAGRFQLALSALLRREDAAAVRLFADAVGGPGTFDRRSPEQKAMMLDNVPAHVADARNPNSRPRFTCEMASRITAPVLLINGTRSPAFFRKIADRLAQCLPNEQRLAIESSHTVPGENPQAFRQAVRAYLKRH